jgi:hypothetical protein
MKGSLPTEVFMAKILTIAAWRAGDTSTLHTLSNRKQYYTGKTETMPSLRSLTIAYRQPVLRVLRHG